MSNPSAGGNDEKSLPSQTGSNGFKLFDADTYSILIEGCSSGYTTTITELNPNIRIYKDDRNCLAKLQSFSNSDGLFLPAGGMGFTSYAEGEVGTFVNGNLDVLEVTIIQQFSNPTLPGDSKILKYRYGISMEMFQRKFL